ncbi:MAG: 23S rRNA (uracil(1939)-C(5))-methyltransferase RlmD [Syntrophorhabdaceae bacterium]
MSEPHCITVTDIAMPTDAGVGKIDDLVVFVPGCVPGDRASVRITRREKRYAQGELIAILEPSPFRIKPECPHFGQCGGCTIQSLVYARQIELKEAHLRQSLRRIGGLDIPDDVFEAIVPSVSLWWYRSKIELSFGNYGNRVIAGMRPNMPAGYSGPSGVVPALECMTFSRSLGNIISIVEDHVHTEGLFPYDERTKTGELRHLILKESKTSGKIMAIVETKGSKPIAMDSLHYRLRREVPGFSSLYRIVNNRPGPYINYDHIIHEGGDRSIDDMIAGLQFRIYPGSFFQPNPAGAALLYERIRAIAAERKFTNVLGLYCGMAPIELLVSPYAQNVTGIDSLKVNIENARENALLNGIRNCTFTAGKVEDIAVDRGFKKPDLIIVDPPRAGISPKGMNVILTFKPASFIYVSCNPATLARDLKTLALSGYHIDRISPFDLFPHTSHIETLAILRRETKK